MACLWQIGVQQQMGRLKVNMSFVRQQVMIIVMPGNKEAKKAIYKAVENGALSQEDIKRCAANVLETMVYSNVFEI